MFAPLRVRELTIPNRVAVTADGDLGAAAGSGAGLVITEFFSVTDDGRITPETPVIEESAGTRLVAGLLKQGVAITVYDPVAAQQA